MSAPLPRAQQLHAALVQANVCHRRSEYEMARLLAELASDELHQLLGYASIYDYARCELELTVRKTQALLHIGRTEGELPALHGALAAGRLPYTKARELLRVITPETEEAWVERGVELTSRQLEQAVGAAVRGEGPPDGPPDPRAPTRQRLCFDMESTDAEVLRAAIGTIRAQASVRGDELSDGEILAELARRFLHDAEADEAPSGERYRTVLQLCPSCEDVHAVEADVSDTVVGEAACDTEVVEMRPGPRRGHLSRTIPPATRRAVRHRDKGRCIVPGCGCRLWIDVHHLEYWSKGGSHDERNLASFCSIHHRMLHAGLLACRPLGDGIVEIETAGGRVQWVKLGVGAIGDPRGRGGGGALAA